MDRVMPDEFPNADEVAAKKGGGRHKEVVSRSQARLNRRKKAKEILYAKELYSKGMSKLAISKEMGRSYRTILGWLKDDVDPVKAAREADAVDVFKNDLSKVAKETIEQVEHEFIDARNEEDEAINTLAQNQNTPADQYQAYVASQSIKILRDSIKAIRGPRTIRELSELDQLIRRNLGLNPKGGSGGKSTLQIDISLLNNTKAVGRNGVIIEAETTDNDE